jgi:hypothetical protein
MIGQKFNEIDATKAHQYVSQSVPAWFKENKKFVGVPEDSSEDREDIEADHWQDGAGFLAPLPPKDDATYDTLIKALKNMFVAEDIIGDCLARRCNGILGKDPQWSFERLEEMENDGQSEDETDEQLDAINEHMAEWWKERNVLGTLKKFANAIGYGKRSFLRIYIPPGRFEQVETNAKGERVTNIVINAATPEDALKHIFIEHLERDQAAVFVDKYSMQKVGIVVGANDISDDEPIDPAIEQPSSDKWAEVSYHNGEMTVLRIVSEGGMEQVMEADLRGRLMLYEGVHALYITDSVKRNQKDLNTTRTQIRINNDNAAFQQRVFINLQPPGSVVTDENGNEVFKVGTYNRGPGQDLNLVGVAEMDERGNLKYSDGRVEVLEPIDNKNLLDSAAEARHAIYRMCKQLHVIISGDATTSGESRLQAQGEYLLDLMDMKGVVDRAGTWLLETVWALAEVIAGSDVPTKDVKAVFDARINPGPITTEMRRAILEMMEKKTISQETAMSMLGVDDVEAEKDRILQEAEEVGPTERANILSMNSQSQQNVIQSALELFTPEMDDDGNPQWDERARQWLQQNGVAA